MMRTGSKSIGNLLTLIALLTSLAGGAVTYTPARAAGILFVKTSATGSEDCSSWANACTLQTAISLSLSGDKIWVQAGTHIPDPTDRAISFNLKNGVAIFGGFNGTETQRNQRNPAVNVTILSGDLNGDDNGFTNNGENSFHVVRSVNNDNTAVLDGFRISGGNANSVAPPPNPDLSGGGMLNSGSNPTLIHLTFAGNSADQGGGIHNDASSPTLKYVTFSGNSARIGGGMSGFDNSNPRLTNVTFSRNSASFHGGGMANARNSPTLINVTFSGNSADVNGGGGIFNSEANPTLINTIIANSLSGGDCVNAGGTSGAFSSNNLIEDALNTCGLLNGIDGNITGVDPKLAPLAFYGGWTRTHALLRGSPAIDAGTNVNCPTTDQRGMPRPRGNACDIGAVEFQTFTIKGNAGAPGVKLSYTDGSPKTATSQADGNYSLTVTDNWSGTVTPSLFCYKFNPSQRSYNPVRANLTGQDYAPSFNAASPCAEVTLRIKATTQTLVIPKNGGQRPSFAGLNKGPVLVNGTGQNNVRFIASARISTLNAPSFIFELMSLPRPLLDTRYAFPFYDSVHFKAHVRLVNVSNVTTQVTLLIGKQPLTNCTPSNSPTLVAGASVLVSCANLTQGPLVVESSAGNILASLRVLPKSGEASVSEVIGIPESQWASRYAFPWYDNQTVDGQLRVANMSTTQATRVRLFIAGVEMNSCTSTPAGVPYPYILQPGTRVRVNCAGVNSGPLQVIGSPGVPIVAALRMILKASPPNYESFAEVMGLPASQWSTRHAFPWYDSKTLNSQLRIANLGAAPTQIRLFIGGVEMTNCTSVPLKPYPFDLPANRSLAVNCPNVNKGPLKVIGTVVGVPLVTSLRLLPRNAPRGTVFSEFMGLPFNKLATAYVLPWYDNLNFSSQLRIAVP